MLQNPGFAPVYLSFEFMKTKLSQAYIKVRMYMHKTFEYIKDVYTTW